MSAEGWALLISKQSCTTIIPLDYRGSIRPSNSIPSFSHRLVLCLEQATRGIGSRNRKGEFLSLRILYYVIYPINYRDEAKCEVQGFSLYDDDA
jgi:hypothetical protein